MMKLFIFLSNLLSLQNPQMNCSVFFYVTVRWGHPETQERLRKTDVYDTHRV